MGPGAMSSLLASSESVKIELYSPGIDYDQPRVMAWVPAQGPGVSSSLSTSPKSMEMRIQSSLPEL